MYTSRQILTAADLNKSLAGTFIQDIGPVIGDINIDLTFERIVKLSLIGSITTLNISTSATGFQSAMLVVTQGGSGSYTIAYPASVKWQGGYSPSLSTAVGATDILQLISLDDGTTWIAAIAFQIAAPS